MFSEQFSIKKLNFFFQIFEFLAWFLICFYKHLCIFKMFFSVFIIKFYIKFLQIGSFYHEVYKAEIAP